VGALDLIRHFPERNEYIIGLLMLDPERRRAGLGTRIHDAVERWVRAEGGTALRLVVQEQNPDALRFWQRQGYEVVEKGPQKTHGRKNVIHILRKSLQ
jgi:GNAT superfamily N-acetyltransferase